MWSVRSDKNKQYKKRVSYKINKNIIDRFNNYKALAVKYLGCFDYNNFFIGLKK